MKVVFACIHNAGGSQMAAAFFNKFARCSSAISAGTEPAEKVHELVVAVMNEVGINLSDTKPQKLTEDLVKDANLLITMGCGESCPVVPGLQRDDWPLPDPKGKSINDVRSIRDEIHSRVINLLESFNDCLQPATNGEKVL